MESVRGPGSESELSWVVGQFAEAVEDARRLLRENLPVLPHQQAAMEAGIDAILAADRQIGAPHIVRSDVLDTFNTRTELMTPAAQGQPGRTAAIVALEETRDQRLAGAGGAGARDGAAVGGAGQSMTATERPTNGMLSASSAPSLSPRRAS